jgi:hypothetical protein
VQNDVVVDLGSFSSVYVYFSDLCVSRTRKGNAAVRCRHERALFFAPPENLKATNQEQYGAAAENENLPPWPFRTRWRWVAWKR